MKAARTHIDILGYKIAVDISQHGVHIVCDDEFHRMLAQHPVEGVDLLSRRLPESFLKERGRPLKISFHSIRLEIWGHHYFEVVYERLKWMLYGRVFRRIRNRLERATEQIDIAEWGHDNNRWVWDVLAPFGKIIEKCIPKPRKKR